MILQHKVMTHINFDGLTADKSLIVLGVVLAVNGLATVVVCYMQFDVYGKRLRREKKDVKSQSNPELHHHTSVPAEGKPEMDSETVPSAPK